MNSFIETLYHQAPVFLQNVFVSSYGYYLNRSRYGGRCREYAGRLARSEQYDAGRIREENRRALRDILCHAGSRVPYYRELFRKTGFDPEKVSGPEDLRRLPILDKETIRRDPEKFLAEGARGVKKLYTSGTSGTPLTIYCNNDSLQRNYAFFLRVASWNNVGMGVRRAIFGGRLIVPGSRRKPPFWRHHWSERSLYFSSFHLSQGNLPVYYDRLRAFSPGEIRTYPSSLYPIARYMKENNLSGIRPRAIVTSSETLFDFQRRLFTRVFGCPVRDQYGSTEFTVFISQCEKGTYHIHPEYSLVEILRHGEPAAPGETGEVICTGFLNKMMPLIRYRQGDLMKRSAKPLCECGRHFPIIEEIEGRADDMIMTPDGTQVGAIDTAFKDLEGVKESQLVQVALDRIVVRIVRTDLFEDEKTGMIRKEFQKRLGKEVRIDFDFVENIPREPNGKFRAVVSLIK